MRARSLAVRAGKQGAEIHRGWRLDAGELNQSAKKMLGAGNSYTGILIQNGGYFPDLKAFPDHSRLIRPVNVPS